MNEYFTIQELVRCFSDSLSVWFGYNQLFVTWYEGHVQEGLTNSKLAAFSWQITMLSRNNGSKSIVKPICMHVFTFQRDKAGIKSTVNRMV